MLFIFSAKSPKNSLLELVVCKHVQDDAKEQVLIDLCQTRWVEHHNVYKHFHQAFTFIVEAQQMITRFDFIVVFLMMYQYQSHMAAVTMKALK